MISYDKISDSRIKTSMFHLLLALLKIYVYYDRRESFTTRKFTIFLIVSEKITKSVSIKLGNIYTVTQ